MAMTNWRSVLATRAGRRCSSAASRFCSLVRRLCRGLATAQAFQSLAAADVNGDGVRQLVGVTSGADGSAAALVVLSADPETLALTQQSSTPLSVNGA